MAPALSPRMLLLTIAGLCVLGASLLARPAASLSPYDPDEAHPCNRLELRDADDATLYGCHLYHEYGCATCHGAQGRGDGRDASVARMRPRPTDLTDAARLRYWSDAERWAVIRDGIPGTAMVGYAQFFSAADLRLLRHVLPYLDWLRTQGRRIGT